MNDNNEDTPSELQQDLNVDFFDKDRSNIITSNASQQDIKNIYRKLCI